MKWNYISLLNRRENCTITFAPLILFLSFFNFYVPYLQMWELSQLGIAGTDALKT